MRLALLTGGSKGLGLELCKSLKDRDYHVIEFSRGAPHNYSIRVDLSLLEESRQAVRSAIDSLGEGPFEEILVVNNAGTLDPIGPASRKSQAAVIGNLNTNFTSAILILTEIVSRYQATPCRKVLANISSGAAQKAFAGWSLYCAAKAGLENFVRALALEQQTQANPFIPINIAPGVMDTALQEYIRTSSISDFPEVSRFIQRKTDGALVAPSKVAAAILRILGLPSLSYGGRYDVAEYFAEV